MQDAVRGDLQTWLETNLKIATKTGEAAILATAKVWNAWQAWMHCSVLVLVLLAKFSEPRSLSSV